MDQLPVPRMKPQTPKNELQRLIYATRNSLHGYRRVWRDEAAFRFQVVILVLLVPLAWWLAASWTQFGLLLFVWALVLVVELANSAIEAAIDRISPERHDLSAKAKDSGSAMVMTTMMLAGFVWLMVLLDRFAG